MLIIISIMIIGARQGPGDDPGGRHLYIYIYIYIYLFTYMSIIYIYIIERERYRYYIYDLEVAMLHGCALAEMIAQDIVFWLYIVMTIIVITIIDNAYINI